MSEQISRENVLEKMHNYLHVWDLVGVINQSIADAEDRNALLDVLEGAQLIIEQLEQAQAEANKWRKQAHEEIEQSESIVAEREELYNEIEQLREENAYLHAKVMHLEPAHQKLVECLEWYGDGSNYQQKPYNTDSGIRLFKSAIDEDNNGQRARQTLSEVKGNDRSDS